MTTKNPHWGTTLDRFLDEEGVSEAAKAEAATRVAAWRRHQEMAHQGMPTSRNSAADIKPE